MSSHLVNEFILFFVYPSPLSFIIARCAVTSRRLDAKSSIILYREVGAVIGQVGFRFSPKTFLYRLNLAETFNGLAVTLKRQIRLVSTQLVELSWIGSCVHSQGAIQLKSTGMGVCNQF